MGTKGNMPNKNLGREMGRDDDEAPQKVNEQEIASDPQSDGGLGTNFTHERKEKKD
jgi:hypothetical protein